MKTLTARKTVESIVRNRMDRLKDNALTAQVSDGKSWCAGAERTVLVSIGADWFGKYTIRCEHDGEVWTVSVDGSHRTNRSASQFDEMMDALRVISEMVDRIDSDLFDLR